MLSNPSFIAKAPESKVAEEKSKLAKNKKSYETIMTKLKELEA